MKLILNHESTLIENVNRFKHVQKKSSIVINESVFNIIQIAKNNEIEKRKTSKFDVLLNESDRKRIKKTNSLKRKKVEIEQSTLKLTFTNKLKMLFSFKFEKKKFKICTNKLNDKNVQNRVVRF